MLPEPMSLSPQLINEDIWYYEEKKGLHFVVWNEQVPGHTRTHQQFDVPWRSVVNTMNRYRKWRRLRP